MSQQTKPDAKSPSQPDQPLAQTPNDPLIAQAVAEALGQQQEQNQALVDDLIKIAVAEAVEKATNDGAKINKEMARIVTIPEPGEKVFLKKDEKKRFGLDPAALKGVVVRQTRTRVIDGVEQELPAHDLNEIGIYTPEEFTEFSKKGGLFEQQKINVTVWHEPDQSDSVEK